MSAGPLLLRLARVSLGGVIAAAILFFIFVTFVRCTLWYQYRAPWQYSEEANTPLTIQYSALVNRYVADGAVFNKLLYGPDAMGFLGWFGSLGAAVLSTLLLRSLPTGHDEGKSGSQITERLIRLVKRVLFYPVPPQAFWRYWCGGLDCLDAFIVLTVCAMTGLWAQQLIAYIFGYINGYVADGTFDDYYEDTTVSLVKLEQIARETGWAIYPPVIFLFMAVPRNSFLQALFGVDFSYLIKYHRWMGHLVMIWTSIHGILYYVLWGIKGTFAQEYRHWQYDFISTLAGNISYLFGLILWASSIEFVRRRFFEVFYRLHIICAIGYYVLAFMHYDGLWWYAAPATSLYFLDLTFRLAQWMNITVISGTLLSEDVLALNLSFAPDTHLEPNSFVYLICPEVSRLQWHPFTLSRVSNSLHKDQPAQATIYLKPYGRWAQGLVRRISEKGAVLAKIDGPYGGASSLVHGDVRAAVIIAGGIGVTPMLGILAALQERRISAQTHGSLTGSPVPEKVVFVWSCRQPEEFDILDPQLLAEAREAGSWLDIQLHQTCDKARSPKEAPGSDSGPRDAKLSLQPGEHLKDSPAVQQPKLSLASPFFLKPSLLQAYGIGYPLWALVHILAFFGTFFSVIPVMGWYVVNLASDPDTSNAQPYWLTCTVEMIALIVGGMGLPSLVIFPVFLWRRHKNQRAAQQHNDNPKGSFWQGSQSSKLEAGLMPDIVPGRPDIHNILQRMHKQHSSLTELHVHVCGPPSMVHDVKRFSARINSAAEPGPHIICKVDSFNL